MPVLEIQHLAKTYGEFTLEIERFTLEPGEIVALVGKNGAGKTTLMRCISGFTTSYEGRITICGETPGKAWKSGCVGSMSEEARLIGDLTVGEHIEFAAALSPTWDSCLADRLTRRLGVDYPKRAGELSRGNRVKLGLVVALARRPKLLLLDEPTSGLDPVVRDHVLSELRAVREIGCAALVSSHILDDFRELADRIAVLKQGRIESQFDNPRSSERLRECVAGFLH